jgi:hypothetical protein
VIPPTSTSSITSIVALWVIRRWPRHIESESRAVVHDRTCHPWPALLVVFQAAIAAAWGFYLWSPLLFADQQGSHDSLRAYVVRRIRDIDSIAIELWGRLGWLDYEIGAGWYVLLYVLVAINLACVDWRPRRPSLAVSAFACTVLLGFVVMTLAGEYGYLTQAGYTLQGRYFLPAILGVASLVLSHRVPLARYALLAGVVVVNLLLAQRTVTRYYDDGWSGVRQSLPISVRDRPHE